MTVLLTRAYHDCLDLGQSIRALGIDIFEEPILNVTIHQPEVSHSYSPYQSFIFTSRNAVKYLQQHNYQHLLQKKCFVIGDATAKLLEDLGFLHIYSANNDMNQLLHNIRSHYISTTDSYHQGSILYLRGFVVSTDIKNILANEQIICDEQICYQASFATNLSQELIQKICNNELKVIVFFSKNTADTFLSLCNKYGIAKFLKKATIVAISGKLKDTLNSLSESDVISFDGNESHLLEFIRSRYAR